MSSLRVANTRHHLTNEMKRMQEKRVKICILYEGNALWQITMSKPVLERPFKTDRWSSVSKRLCNEPFSKQRVPKTSTVNYCRRKKTTFAAPLTLAGPAGRLPPKCNMQCLGHTWYKISAASVQQFQRRCDPDRQTNTQTNSKLNILQLPQGDNK